MPRMTTAISVGSTLNPSWGSRRIVNGTAMPMSASDGIARPRFATLIAMRSPRRVCPTHRPIGMAMSHGDQRAPASDSAMCSPIRTGIPFGPDQFAGSVSQATVSVMMVTRLLLRDGARTRSCDLRGVRPGVMRRWTRDQREVDGDGQEHRRHGAEQHLGREVVPPALEDEEAEAAEAVADGRRDRHEPDRGHARDPEPGDRSAAPPAAARRATAAARRVAHAVGRLERCRAGRASKPGDDVADEDQDRVQDERDLER